MIEQFETTLKKDGAEYQIRDQEQLVVGSSSLVVAYLACFVMKTTNKVFNIHYVSS